MKKFGLPQCPYCGRKVNPFYAWVLRTQGEYICPSCKGVSNIVLSPLAKLLGAGAAIVGIIVFVIALLDKETDLPLFYLLWIMAPFVLFSILSAFCVQLKKPILRRREAPGQQQRKPAPNAAQRSPGAAQAARPARTAPSLPSKSHAVQTSSSGVFGRAVCAGVRGAGVLAGAPAGAFCASPGRITRGAACA